MTYNFPAQIYYFDCESGCGNVWKKHQTDQLPVQRTADGGIFHDRQSVYAPEAEERLIWLNDRASHSQLLQ